MDVVLSRDSDDLITWHANDGTGLSWTDYVIESTTPWKPQQVVGVDIDGDSDMDVASCDEESDTVMWYENQRSTETTPTKHTIDGAFTTEKPKCVATADLDGDNDADVVVGGTSDVQFYKNQDGLGTSWAKLTPVTTGTIVKARAVALGDIDGDADIDIAVADHDGDVCGWLENIDGHASWSWNVVATAMGQAHGVSLGDYDGDQDLDMVCVSQQNPGIYLYFNTDGAGTFGATQTIDTAALKPRFGVSADLDGESVFSNFIVFFL